MKNFLILFLFTFSFLNTQILQSQLTPFGFPNFTNNDLNSFCCECYTIRDACSKEILKLDGAELTIRCSSFLGDRPISQTVRVENGRVCIPQGYLKGCEGSLTSCLDFGNWEICDVKNCGTSGDPGCQIFVYQTLSTYPRLNGQLLGNGFSGTSSNTSTQCGRKNESALLNNPNNPQNISLCPGDPAIFSMGGFSIPDKSGMCLEVTIKQGSQVVASDLFGSGAFHPGGNSADFTHLFQNLIPGVTYSITLRSRCCSGEATCTRNSTKIVYFRMSGSLSFSDIGNSGFGSVIHQFPVASSPPSTLLPGATSISIPPITLNLNQFSLDLFNVLNPNNNTIDWVWKERNCETGEPSGLNLDEGTITPHSFQPNGIGPFLIVVQQDCQCYVLELTYTDDCTGERITKEYYVKEGANCREDAVTDENDDVSFRHSDSSMNESVRLVQNPISNELSWQIDTKLLTENIHLSIYDASGREIKKMTHVSTDVLNGMSFNEKDGLYIYQLYIGDKVFTGKFIKASH